MMALTMRSVPMRRPALGIAALLGYIGTIFLANWLIDIYGIVTVWPAPHLLAPAGVFAAGFAFFARDLTQEWAGTGWCFAGIVIGAALSAFVSPALALASGLAFFMSETLDLMVYSPLRAHNFLAAVVLSNTAGLVLDSVIFLFVAYNSFDFLAGQVVGKLLSTIFAAAIIIAVRQQRAWRPLDV